MLAASTQQRLRLGGVEGLGVLGAADGAGDLTLVPGRSATDGVVTATRPLL
ncbi:hypothetical protein [Aeromicrobium sp. UC242_57]|uniref:hypothetical protein n=1 Tax=Aeromicrobium sp. UC242_57 TaxID=3374624 RepID=UPI0037A712A7